MRLEEESTESRDVGRNYEGAGRGKEEETRLTMPLGKYYCDYCDKQFQDTAAARRRHLQGAQHHRARALWYDSVCRQESHGGAPPLLQPVGAPLAKGVCNHFARTGTCKFGDSCRYFHPKIHAANSALATSGPIPGELVQQLIFLEVNPVLFNTSMWKEIRSQGTY